MDAHNGARLCEFCSALELETKLLDAVRYFKPEWQVDGSVRPRPRRQVGASTLVYDTGVFICSFGTRLSLPTQTCSLCLFFSTMRIQAGEGMRHKLLALCCSSMYFLNGRRLRGSSAWKEFEHEVFLAVLPEVDGMLPHEYNQVLLFHEARHVGVIHRVLPLELRAGADSRLVLRPQTLAETVDFSRISQWLSYCSDHHGERCAASKGSGAGLKELRVIDCAADPPTIEIQPFTVRYAALSYVWGNVPPTTWPAVALDAVEVTRKLGLRFLWVDRLCIDQGNHAEKDYLISKMAWIYGCAEFTIVAAAGADAAYGLPGIRSIRRSPQPGVHLSPELTLVSSMRDPRIAIEESVWSTRGWTYQEGVLSRRRLVFTDEQVYFECHGMALWESLELPLDLYHSESARMMDSHVRSGVFRGSTDPRSSAISTVWGFGATLGSPSRVYQGTLRIDDHIYAFSRRVLSYDADSLRAFSGVIDRLASGGALRMILGLPVWAGGRHAGAALLLSFGLSLSCWAHVGNGPGLGEDEFCTARRRSHLPSWTWAGWARTITWCGGASVHSLVVEAMVGALDTSELESELPYAPAMALQDGGSGSLVRLSGADSLDGLANDRPYRLLITEPLILDVRSQAFDPEKITIMMSIMTTKDDVVKAHATGDMASVLTFFGHIKSESTVARFIVLAEAPSCPGLRQPWKRVGKLDMFFFIYAGRGSEQTAETLQKMPIKQWVDTVTVV